MGLRGWWVYRRGWDLASELRMQVKVSWTQLVIPSKFRPQEEIVKETLSTRFGSCCWSEPEILNNETQ